MHSYLSFGVLLGATVSNGQVLPAAYGRAQQPFFGMSGPAQHAQYAQQPFFGAQHAARAQLPGFGMSGPYAQHAQLPGFGMSAQHGMYAQHGMARPGAVSYASSLANTAGRIRSGARFYGQGFYQGQPRSIAQQAQSQVLVKLADKVQEKAEEVMDEEVYLENENGLQCCSDLNDAHCAACVMNMDLRDFCSTQDVRYLTGCGLAFDNDECGDGIPSSDGLVCCDPEQCGGKCGGAGCAWTLGGPAHCCASAIKGNEESCDVFGAPCVNDRIIESSRSLYGSPMYHSGPAAVSVQPSPPARLYFPFEPLYYDDGTEIPIDYMCKFHFTCSACALNGCSWGKDEVCAPYDGVSHGKCDADDN